MIRHVSTLLDLIKLSKLNLIGDDALPGILSGLEICTGIVACCAVTYRPLIERVFIQRESNVRAESQTNLSYPTDSYSIPQEWEMRRMK
jgi:hypothetical protein